MLHYQLLFKVRGTKGGTVDSNGHGQPGTVTVNSSIDMDVSALGIEGLSQGQGQHLSLFDHSSRSTKVTPIAHHDD